MDDLVRWLGEQLDVDKARADAAAEELGPDWHYDDGFVLARREGDMVATGSQDFLEAERGRFIAAHDPARVLREIDAKRQIVRWHYRRPAPKWDLDGVEGFECATCDQQFPCKTLRLLALPYADRPGYAEAIASVE
ncbi:DUF6221 family protein [Streptomyces sp. ActVer]|uniref:DUF6221 family protein n=1 Tax=Streptomyces sp. ActVer TaxID=3014558 RepID=UPI0022B33BED|nr:DUF6221 family protein [Streptomyces sp. ActVer]MCZ4513497.1 DUF6221 family protein [Streptomyces sp. ActVer]